MKLLSLLIMMGVTFGAQAYDHKILNMSPPKVKSLQKKQVERMAPLRDYKFAGFIGESDNGLLAIRDIKTVSAANQKILKKLVEDENKDRIQIYKEIGAFNKLDAAGRTMLIQNFYEVYRNTDAKGTFYFEKGTWQKHY